MTAAREENEVGREDLFEAEIHITADTGEPGSKRRGGLFYLHILAFLFGAALLFFLIRAVGVEPIFKALGQIHYGYLKLLGLAGERHAMRTLTMRVAQSSGVFGRIAETIPGIIPSSRAKMIVTIINSTVIGSLRWSSVDTSAPPSARDWPRSW